MNPAESGVILLVEDNPNDVLLIRRAIRKAHLANRVEVVDDGEKAIAYLQGEDRYADRVQYPLPALVLLDLKLPRKSGFEVLAWLKAQPVLARVPVVVLTSSNQRADIDRAYDLGANSFLVKPVGFEALFEMMQAVQPYWMILNQPPDLSSQP